MKITFIPSDLEPLYEAYDFSEAQIEAYQEAITSLRPEHALSCFIGNLPFGAAMEHAAKNAAFVCAPPIGLRDVIQALSLSSTETLKTTREEVMSGYVGIYMPDIMPADTITVREFSSCYQRIVHQLQEDLDTWPLAHHALIEQQFEQRVISLLRQLPEIGIVPALEIRMNRPEEHLIYSF